MERRANTKSSLHSFQSGAMEVASTLPTGNDVSQLDTNAASSSAFASEAAFTITAPLVLLPFDLVRVRLQTQGPTQTHSSIRGVLSNVVATQGIRRLWIGAGPALVSSFGRLGEDHIPSPWEDKKLSHIDAAYEYGLQSFGWQLGLGTLFCIASHPFELIQARMQYQRPELGTVYKSSLECAKAAFCEGGAKGFFRGLTPRLVGTSLIIAGTTLPVISYRRFHPESKKFDDATVSQQALMLVPSATALALAQPFDVISTRLQVMQPSQSLTGRIVFRSMRDEARSVIALHGVRGLYAGILTSGLAAACSTLVWFPLMFAASTYESLQSGHSERG